MDLGRAKFQQAGNFANRIQGHAAQFVLHHMQGGQRYGLFVRIARHIGQDLLPQFFAQYTHRSSSAAMMFRLPSTATTSLIWCPLIRYGKIAKWIYDGGRVRARYERSLPSETT